MKAGEGRYELASACIQGRVMLVPRMLEHRSQSFRVLLGIVFILSGDMATAVVLVDDAATVV